MTPLESILLQVVWVSAHHGLRIVGRYGLRPGILWEMVHELTRELGHPTPPGGP